LFNTLVLIDGKSAFLGKIRYPFFILHCWFVKITICSPFFFLYLGSFGRPRYFSGYYILPRNMKILPWHRLKTSNLCKFWT